MLAVRVLPQRLCNVSVSQTKFSRSSAQGTGHKPINEHMYDYEKEYGHRRRSKSEYGFKPNIPEEKDPIGYSWQVNPREPPHEEYVVPDWRVFNLERAHPDLKNHVRKLTLMGLTDPWARNYAYTYVDGYARTFSKKHWIFLWYNFGHKQIYFGIIGAVILIILDKTLLMPHIRKHQKESTDADHENPSHSDILHHH